MTTTRRLLLCLVALSALLATALPGSASARRNPYRASQVCGAGFVAIDHQVLRPPGVTLATTWLLYNRHSGRNCVVTLKNRRIGRRTWTTAGIRRRGGRQHVDAGYFRYYAGPRYVYARHRCVEWGGGARQGTLSIGFLSGWEHCG